MQASDAKGLRVLYIADPSSVHDLKWMTPGGPSFERFLVLRKCHATALGPEWLRNWSQRNEISVIGAVDDFSVVRFWRTLWQLFTLWRWIRAHRIDLVHIMFAEPNALWAVFRRAFRTPIIVTTRGTDVLKTIPRFFANRKPLNLIVAWLYRTAFAQVDAFTSTSETQRASLRALFRAPPERLNMVRTGVDIEALLKAAQAKSRRISERAYIFFPRLMRPIYGHEFALEAIALLPKNIREEYQFVFVGKDSADRQYLEQIQNQMAGIKANFLILDALSQPSLHHTLAKAALVVMTPRSDGSSVTAAETLLCRTPLILPPHDYDRDIFGRGPFFFADWDPDTLSALMIEVLEGEWKTRVNEGFEDASQHFDRQREMSKLRDIYTQALS